MATIQEMKNAILSVYPTSASWKRKVDAMHESQITAVFLSFQKSGAFNKPAKFYKNYADNPTRKSFKPNTAEVPHQISIEEFIMRGGA